jgi:hypothetical protein
MTKFIMKNGCCRDCMKAFSKNGKVTLLTSNISLRFLNLIIYSLACVKSRDFREGLPFQPMDASIADARVAIRSISEETRDRRSKVDLKRKASIIRRGRGC